MTGLQLFDERVSSIPSVYLQILLHKIEKFYFQDNDFNLSRCMVLITVHNPQRKPNQDEASELTYS